MCEGADETTATTHVEVELTTKLLDGHIYPCTAEEEAAILRVIRRGGRWPCFEGKDVKYGIMRYRGLGYHERRRVEGAGEPSTPRAGRQGDDDASSGSSGDDDGDRTDEVDNDTSPITTLLPPTNKRPLTGPSSSKPRSYALQLGGSRLTTDAKRPRIEDESADEFEQSLTWHPHALMLWRLSQGLSSFFTATTEAFDRFFAMRRLISIARGKFHSTSKDEIEALFQQECARYPDEGIMIVDPIAKDQRHRIIKTNEMCISMLGRISTEDGGIHRPLFPAESFLTMVKYQILAWCRCGEDVPFEARLYNHSMEIIKVKMTCRVVPQRVVICRGVPI